MRNVQLIVPAAGLGTRLGAGGPKALHLVAGTPLLVHTLRRFTALDLLDAAVIAFAPGYESEFRERLAKAFPGVAFCAVEGGATRQESVRRALAVLSRGTEIAVIHDAARPFVSAAVIRDTIAAAREYGAATAAAPVVDTILVGDEKEFLVDTPERKTLWACQTPQAFRVDLIRNSHKQAANDGFEGTDDASLVRRIGRPVKLVPSDRGNVKITTPEDIAYAQWRLVAGGG